MKILTSFIFILSLFSSTTQAQNLIKNNKFNAGVESWEVLLAEESLPIKAQVIEHSKDYGSYGLADNYINTSFVELDATSAIQQKISTDNSDNYTLIFACAHRPNAGDKQLVVTANGTVIHTETIKNNASVGSFKYTNIYFTAPSSTTKLSFYAVSISGPDDQGILLTDISCEKTAEININNPNHTKKTR
jgi:hypothetical protein